MTASIVIEKDTDKIRGVIEECDNTFLIGITKRENYLEILCKMQQYANIIVARDELGVTLGYASMYANNEATRTAFISMFGVKKEYQGHHLGTLLMDKCVEVARMNGMRVIKLEVLKQNANGYAFYLRYGFKTLEAFDKSKILSLDI